MLSWNIGDMVVVKFEGADFHGDVTYFFYYDK